MFGITAVPPTGTLFRCFLAQEARGRDGRRINSMHMNQTQTVLGFSVVTEIEVRYKNPIKPSLRPKVTSSQSAYEIFRDTWNPDTLELRESFKVMLLSHSNRVLGIANISDGGLTGTVADARLIFADAIKAAATCIILCHNHPSGNCKPSKPDQELTEQLRQVGDLLGIPVVDHLIITGEGYYSFTDNGEL